jgi:hypothetical protein
VSSPASEFADEQRTTAILGKEERDKAELSHREVTEEELGDEGCKKQ